jgi:hypothetical protein
MDVFHYSENPTIPVFHPHVPKTSADQSQALVWAIDAWHSPMYCVPRACPRLCFWAGPQTSEADREAWLHGLAPRFVMVVEAAWLRRMCETPLYRYVMPSASFIERADDSGHFVSSSSVVPDRVEPVGDLFATILSAGVELRFAERLGPLWQRVSTRSTLHFSGTRLKNALGYPAEFHHLGEAG